MAVIVILIVIIVAFILIEGVHVIGKPAISTSTQSKLAAQTTMAGLVAQSESLYNSAGPFNYSYESTFYNSSSLEMENLTFYLAKLNNYFKLSYIMKSPVVPNISQVENTFVSYNGTYLDGCSKITFENTSAVNSTVISEINMVNANATPKCNSIVVPSNISSFDMAYLFSLIPPSINGIIDASSSLNSYSAIFPNASITFISSNNYLGMPCDLENITIKQNPQSNVQNLNIQECISTSNGLPLSTKIYQNNKLFIEDIISSVNAAPTSISAITSK